MYRIESLYSVLESDISLYVNYTLIKKEFNMSNSKIIGM